MSKLALAMLAVLVSGCDVGGGDSFVVHIDEGGVRLADLRDLLDVRVEEEGEERRDDILNEELDRLVEEELALLRADQLGIEISDEEVSAWLQQLHGPGYASDDPAFQEAVRRQIAAERAALIDLASSVHVPEDAVITHFEENLDGYQRAARIQLRQIVVQDELRARQLLDELRAGADFSTLAKANSQAPEAADGGLLPAFARGEMPEVFDRAFDLELDEISEIQESAYGYHIFLLVARFQPQIAELADVRAEIFGELQARRFAELKRGWLRDLRRSADIRVNERVLETLR